MRYEVKYDPKALKQLDKLPKDIAQRIVKKMAEVGETGRGIEAIVNAPYGYKVRVGDYRVLIDLSFNPHIILVRYVDHRSRIYKLMHK